MESWPLSKKNATLTCGDVTHVVRETFRDFYNKKLTHSNFTVNTINCPISNTELQNCANEIHKVFQQHHSYVQDIQEVEQIIAQDIEKCIDRDKFIKENVIANSNMKLKKHPVFKDLDPEIVKKYSLIQSDDLLPPPIERITDFTYDYDLQNHYKKHLESNSYGSLIHCHYFDNHLFKTRIGLCSVKTENVEKECNVDKRKRIQLDALQYPPTLKKVCGNKEIEKNQQIRLKADPECVLFYDYKINAPYERLVKIRNVAGSITRFTPPVFNDHTKFKIIWKHLTTSITPGMCISLVVQFFTQTYDDTQTYLKFRVKDGKDLIIKLISKRPVPLLAGIMFYGSSCMNWYNSTTTQINKVLNSTIECKQCLIGKTNEIILSFCKYGADSSYFLISEYSWYNMVVNEISTNLEIKLPPFTIYPAYFSIKSNEIIDIHIEYAPQEFGLHLNKLIVICDNCTYDHLDLVGDGVYFQPDYIKLQVSEKEYSVVYDSDYESKYVLNLGNVLTFRKSATFDIYVTNTSVLKFNYRWELRPPKFKMKPNTKLLWMNPKWIKLTPLKGRLNRETDSKFTISVIGNSHIGGHYRYVIEFYITDIPVAALADNHTFTVVDSDHNEESNMVDILIGEIELWLQIDEASILIDPCLMHIYVKEEKGISRRIQVLNLCNYSLNCTWINKLQDNGLKVYPEEFVLEANQICNCKFVIHRLITEDTSAEFICHVTGTNLKISLNIYLTPTIPIIETTTRILNFGHVKYAANVAKYFRIFNSSLIPLKWYITEFIYDHKTHSLRKAVKPSLNVYYGVLDNNGMKCDLEYGLWTGTIGKWCSILVITTKVACDNLGTDFVLVFGEILAPLLNILAPPSFTAVLRTSINYVNVKKFYFIQLRNNSTIKLSYAWERPEGRDVSKLEFFIWPLVGIIQPMTMAKLYVVLEPKSVGDVTDFHVPCFVGGNLEPMWLSVETTVKDISVLIYHAYRNNPHEFVEWPPNLDEDIQLSISLSKNVTTTSSFITTSDTLSVSSNTKSLSYHKSEESMLYYDAGGIHIDRKFTTKSVLEQQSDIWSEDFPSGMTYTTYSSRNSFISLPSSKKSHGLLFYHNKAQLLKQSPYQMELRLKNINLRTANKRTILIKNQTPITAMYRVYAKNFGLSDVKIPVDFIDRIETEVSNKKDRWARYLNKTCVGFILHIEPRSGIIDSNDYITFDIWIYGDTWGTYQDEITIIIQRQPPFKINLVVDIVGQPIMFPMLCDSAKDKEIQKYPIVRFGSVAYETESITRKVKVKNISTINLTLVWHVFLRKHNGNRKDDRVSVHQHTPPFNLVLDIFNLPNDLNIGNGYRERFTKLELLVTQFFGDEDFYIFTVNPKEMKIMPQATDVIEITFNPQEFHPIWGEMKLEAFIVGHVKISENDSMCDGVFYRHPLYNTIPTKIKLEATLVLPLTNLQLLQGDIKFKVYAAEVISQCKRLTIHRTFLMRNNNNVPINARLHIQPPFKIIEVKTKGRDEKTTKNKIMNVHIDPGLCAEILLKCNFNKKFIQNVSENIDINVAESHYSIFNKTVSIPHELIIEQPNLITQRVPLEIVVIYPDISISTVELDFGPVSIGYTKTLTILITNRTCSDIEFTISKKMDVSNFTIDPLSGILPKVLAGRSYRYHIDVTFKPLEIERYMETIVICVGKSNFIQDINIDGTGTLNLRYK